MVHRYPPGMGPQDAIELRNEAGERRWCLKPETTSPAGRAVAVVGGGVGGAVGLSAQARESAACQANARAMGFVPLDEAPPPAAGIEARRQAEQAARDDRAAQSRRVRPDTN